MVQFNHAPNLTFFQYAACAGMNMVSGIHSPFSSSARISVLIAMRQGHQSPLPAKSTIVPQGTPAQHEIDTTQSM